MIMTSNDKFYITPLIFQLVQCAVVMEVRRNALKAPKRGSGDLDTPLNWSPALF